jgi:DNA-binding SARP family transcriptional activator
MQDAGLSQRTHEPFQTGVTSVRLYTLGPLRVFQGPDEVRGDWLDQRPGRLLRYLVAVRRRAVPHEEIADRLWPHLGTRGPPTVRHAVHLLRRKLGAPETVVTTRGAYSLATGVEIDVDAFEFLVRAGITRLAAGGEPEAERLLTEATSLYNGEFLAEERYADWVFMEREGLRAQLGDALRGLIDIRLRDGDALGALPHSAHLATLEPFDTDAQAQLISILIRLGRRTRALRTLEAFKTRLRSEFGEPAPPELNELIRAGQDHLPRWSAQVPVRPSQGARTP